MDSTNRQFTHPKADLTGRPNGIACRHEVAATMVAVLMLLALGGCDQAQVWRAERTVRENLKDPKSAEFRNTRVG